MDEITEKLIIWNLNKGYSQNRISQMMHISRDSIRKVIESKKEPFRDVFDNVKLTRAKYDNIMDESNYEGGKKEFSERKEKAWEMLKERFWNPDLSDNTNESRLLAIHKKIHDPKAPIEEIIQYFAIQTYLPVPEKHKNDRQKKSLIRVRNLAKKQSQEIENKPNMLTLKAPVVTSALRNKQLFMESMKPSYHGSQTTQHKQRNRGVVSKVGLLKREVRILKKNLSNPQKPMNEFSLKVKLNELEGKIERFSLIDAVGRFKKGLPKLRQVNLGFKKK